MTIKDGNPYNQRKYTPEMIDLMLNDFRDGTSITGVCVTLDISRETYHRWKKENPEFADAAARGEAISQRFWEKKGQAGVFGEIDKFSGSSWQFVMKNRFRADYRDEQAVQTNNTLIEKLLEKL